MVNYNFFLLNEKSKRFADNFNHSIIFSQFSSILYNGSIVYLQMKFVH